MSDAGIDNCINESKFIVFKVLNMTSSDFLLNRDRIVSSEEEMKIHSLAHKRISGLPIQYVLGEWDFMGFTFSVGEGVLIPRPETELICEYVVKAVKDNIKPVIIDLCAGSGCIGLSIAKLLPESEVYLVEKSDKALYFLKENAKRMLVSNAQIIHGDIFNIGELFNSLPLFDVIISNPPYIRSSDIPTLQSEVLKEPTMALDGGEDGFDFYRCLCNEWTKQLKNEGKMVLECGEDQADYIGTLFEKNSLEHKIVKDYNNIERIIIGGKTDDF